MGQMASVAQNQYIFLQWVIVYLQGLLFSESFSSSDSLPSSGHPADFSLVQFFTCFSRNKVSSSVSDFMGRFLGLWLHGPQAFPFNLPSWADPQLCPWGSHTPWRGGSWGRCPSPSEDSDQGEVLKCHPHFRIPLLRLITMYTLV